jgi:hypothetical protein
MSLARRRHPERPYASLQLSAAGFDEQEHPQWLPDDGYGLPSFVEAL